MRNDKIIKAYPIVHILWIKIVLSTSMAALAIVSSVVPIFPIVLPKIVSTTLLVATSWPSVVSHASHAAAHALHHLHHVAEELHPHHLHHLHVLAAAHHSHHLGVEGIAHELIVKSSRGGE